MIFLSHYKQSVFGIFTTEGFSFVCSTFVKSRRLKGRFEHRERSRFVRMFESVSGTFNFCPNVRKNENLQFCV
jgi:hypothetical protein